VQYIRTDTSGAPEANLQSRYYGRFTKITSTGKFEITQMIEGVDSQNVRGRTVRVQIKMRGLVAASALWNVGLVQFTGTVDPNTANFIAAQGANGTDPTLGAGYAYITPNGAFPADGGVIVGNKIQATITNSATWVRVGGCFDVPTTANNLVVMIWSDSGVVATNGIALGEACLADSTAIQNWEPLAVSLELVRTQRFYCKSFNIDQLPVNNATFAGAVMGWVSVSGATAGQLLPIRFPVSMRRAPVLTFFNLNGGSSGGVYNFVTGTTSAAGAVANTPAFNGVFASFTGVLAWTIAQTLGIHFTADIEL